MGFPLLNAAIGVGTNALFNSINQNQYRSNQRFAQQLAQENALFQDDLTRKLTRDTPLLERQGLVNAGINPASMQSGTMAAKYLLQPFPNHHHASCKRLPAFP